MDAVEKWQGEDSRWLLSRPAVRRCFCFSVGGDCGRWVVYSLTSGGAFYPWAARWLLSGGAPAVDVLCAVVAVAVEEGAWRRAVCSYALNDVVFGSSVRIDADKLL